jgi:ATP-dependent RNA helicase DDX23/PRP28
MTDNDLSAIRSRYLGVDKKKRKIRKMNDRKFVFDWDEQEDTFADSGTPTTVVPGAGQTPGAVMFGRGHLAGMDDGGIQEAALNNRHTDPMERRKASKAGIDERHWSDKSLAEMKDRDWRIFREDFNIAARGLQSILLFCVFVPDLLLC